ncbi:MAG: hypothetical protein ACI9VR_002015 [Cognaticolwellia sp.]|jgi:hypothetical protein
MTPILLTLSLFACEDTPSRSSELSARIGVLEAQNQVQSQALGLLIQDQEVAALLLVIERLRLAQESALTAEDLEDMASRDWVDAGYAASSDLLALQLQVDTLNLELANTRGRMAEDALELATAKARLDDLRGRMDISESGLSRVAAAEELLQLLSVSADGDLVLSQANLYVQSGDGATDAPVNGKGNIILGYDEDDGNDKSGSHNLILGSYHSYTSYGGVTMGLYNETNERHVLVQGQGNTMEGAFGVVLASTESVGGAHYAAVLGGSYNLSQGTGAVVVGGSDNVASGDFSVVSGGQNNEASGTGSSVAGGYGGSSSGRDSAILGGRENAASGSYSTVAGGAYGEALGQSSAISGGYFSLAKHAYSMVVGGDTLSTTMRYDMANAD